VAQIKVLNEFVLSPLQSLFMWRVISCDLEEVVKIVLSQPLNLGVHQPKDGEGVVLSIDCVELLSEAKEFVLEGEEAIAHKVKSVGLN